jgi:hypothetical protein
MLSTGPQLLEGLSVKPFCLSIWIGAASGLLGQQRQEAECAGPGQPIGSVDLESCLRFHERYSRVGPTIANVHEGKCNGHKACFRIQALPAKLQSPLSSVGATLLSVIAPEQMTPCAE